MEAGNPVIGMVGGLAPESTVFYYRSLIREGLARLGAAPMILMVSLDAQRALALAALEDKTPMLEYMVGAVERLSGGGADYAFISANTPHIVFDRLCERVAIPLISIVDATLGEVKRRGLTRVGLIGTRFTMSAGFYQTRFAEAGVEMVVPAGDDLTLTHERYVGELVPGRF